MLKKLSVLILSFTIFNFLAPSLLSLSISPLTKDTPVTPSSLSRKSALYYTFTVPNNLLSLSVSTTGSTGDIDIYLNKDKIRTSKISTWRSTKSGSSESITLSRPTGGTYYLTALAYTATTNTTITLKYVDSVTGVTTLLKNVPVQVTSLSKAEEKYFSFSLPSGSSNLVVTTTGTTGDADIFLSPSGIPTPKTALLKSTTDGSNERIAITSPNVGTYYLTLRAYTATSNTTVALTYTTPSTLPVVTAPSSPSSGGGASAPSAPLPTAPVSPAPVPTPTPTPTPVSGSCGTSANKTLSSVPTSNLCATGTASSVTSGTNYSWSCTGSNGGTAASCTSSKTVVVTPVNYTLTTSATNGTITSGGTYASGTSVTLTATPSTGYTFSSFTGCTSTSANTCTVLMTGNKTVSASFTITPVAVNGSCGTSANQTLSASPTSNLCSTGAASAVTSGTNYSWSCTGANGGVPASCYANKIVQVLVTPPATIAQQNRSYGAVVDAGQTDDPLVDGVSYSGEVYYIDCLGDDTKDGKTPLTAWRTTSQVNTKTNVGYWDTAAPNGNTNPKNHTPWVAAPSGSAFLFKRGCVFDGFINVHASNFTKTPVVSIENITFGAYGERSLARPKFRYSTLSNLYRGSLWNNGHIVHIKNLHFDGGGTSSSTGISLYKSSGSTVENSVIENIQNDGINADFSDNILVKNTTILNTNLNQGRGGGFTGSGNNLKILNSTFIDNGRDQIGAHDIYVRHLTNSVIDGNLLKGGSNLGIVIHGSSTNVSITNNDIYGNSNGIDVTGGYAESETFDGILIANNKIHDNGYRTGEQGYGLLLRSMINSSIVNNIIYGNRLGGMVFQDGTAGDAMSKNVYIYNNTFSGKDAFHLGGGNLSLVSIKNNIFNTTDNTAAFTKRAEVPYSAFVSNNNLYFSNINSTTTVLSDGVKKYSVVSFASTTGQEKFSFYGDPLFLDSATYDFRLQTSSPAKNQGVAPKIIKDFDGVLRNATTPSLGAFE